MVAELRATALALFVAFACASPALADNWKKGGGGADTNADTICSGTSVYLDGEGNCDTISASGGELVDNGTDLQPGDAADDWVRISGDTNAPAIGTTTGGDVCLDLDGGATLACDVTISVSGETVTFNRSSGSDVSYLFSNSGAGNVSIVSDAHPTPAHDFDDSDDSGTVEGSINVNCPTANDCDLELAVNSGADTETVMLRIDTETGGASVVQIGSTTAGNDPTNRTEWAENGAPSFVGTARPEKTVYMPSWSLNPDATNCGAPAATTINSGAIEGTINCGDNDSSTIYGSFVPPDNWDAGTITVKIHAFNENATPSGDLDADVSASCRGDSDVLNNTWGTEIALDVTFGTQNDLEVAESAAITANGTCAVGDHLFWRYQVDATGTTTQVADTEILGFTIGYTVTDLDEVD